MPQAAHHEAVDPRLYQILILTSLLTYGMWRMAFDVSVLFVGAVVATALLTQWIFTAWRHTSPFDPRSALISALSLCLLLRTDAVGLAMAVAVITIAGKYLFHWNGKHIWNPTNFGLAVAMLTGWGWVSPGQWGREAVFLFVLACAGLMVTRRARRSDVTWAFAGVYTGLVFGRAWWLGDPWEIPFHQLQNGALWVFAFLMMSDPKTTPDSRCGRIVFAATVAGVGWMWQYLWFDPQGLIWALAVSAVCVPLLDRWWPDARYQWPETSLVAATKPSPVAARQAATQHSDVMKGAYR